VTRRLVAGLTLLGATAGLVGCVSTQEVGGSNKPTPTTTTVPPATGTFGADVAYGGVLATVVDVMAFDQSPDAVPRVKVVMRSENTSDHVQHNPNLELICDESTNTGDWFLGSTWEPNVVLPVNVVAQGEVIIGFPDKVDNPEYPVVSCTTPRLRLTVEDVRTDAVKTVDYPVPVEVVTEATKRPRGPALPLPPRGS